ILYFLQNLHCFGSDCTVSVVTTVFCLQSCIIFPQPYCLILTHTMLSVGNIKNTNVLCFCCLFLHDFLTFFCSLLGKSLIHFNFPSSFHFLFLSLSVLKYSWCFIGSSLTLCRYSLSLSAPLFPFGILVSYDSFSPEQFQIEISIIYIFTI